MRFTRSISSLTSRIPAVLSLSLLVFQAVAPWTAHQFVTQDGPSHLYTAVVAGKLVFNSHSPYASVYQFNPRLSTNWATVVLFNVVEPIFSAVHAEQAVATLSVLFGFFSLWYLAGALDPEANAATPMLNFLLNVWFLWIGFYNFYLGMAAAMLVIGLHLRRKNLLWVCGALLALFFVHILAAAIAILTIFIVAVWDRVFDPEERIPQLLLTCAALFPSALLIVIFSAQGSKPVDFHQLGSAGIGDLGKHVFASAWNFIGDETPLRWPMIAYIAAGILLTRRTEWRTARGGVLFSAILLFCVYLIAPDSALGGTGLKDRLTWAFFLLAGIAVSVIGRMRPLRIPISLYLTIFLALNLLQAARENVRAVSHVMDRYEAAVRGIPEGSNVMRVLNPTWQLRARAGYGDIAVDPLLHADSWMAARNGWVDLTDYQALSGLFPVVCKPVISTHEQRELWDLEGGAPLDALLSLRASFARPMDFVVLVGAPDSEADRARMERMRAILTPGFREASSDPSHSFVWVYANESKL